MRTLAILGPTMDRSLGMDTISSGFLKIYVCAQFMGCPWLSVTHLVLFRFGMEELRAQISPSNTASIIESART
jgi:hypothetical protein